MSDCRHKFASNVVEKALQHSNPDECEGLVAALMGNNGEKDRIASLLRDPFGNFPVQVSDSHLMANDRPHSYMLKGIKSRNYSTSS